MFLLYHCVKKIYGYLLHGNYLTFKHPALNKFCKYHLYLQFHNGLESTYIYLLTLKAHISEIEFSGSLSSAGFNFLHYPFFSILRIDWLKLGVFLKVKSLEIPLPQLVRIPLPKVRCLRAITNDNQFTVELYAGDGTQCFHINKCNDITRIDTNSEGPYSKLISELQTRNAEYAHAASTSSASAPVDLA